MRQAFGAGAGAGELADVGDQVRRLDSKGQAQSAAAQHSESSGPALEGPRERGVVEVAAETAHDPGVVAEAERGHGSTVGNKGDVRTSLTENSGDGTADEGRVDLPDREGQAEPLVLEPLGDEPVPLVTADGVHLAVDGEQQQGGGATYSLGPV